MCTRAYDLREKRDGTLPRPLAILALHRTDRPRTYADASTVLALFLDNCPVASEWPEPRFEGRAFL